MPTQEKKPTEAEQIFINNIKELPKLLHHVQESVEMLQQWEKPLKKLFVLNGIEPDNWDVVGLKDWMSTELYTYYETINTSIEQIYYVMEYMRTQQNYMRGRMDQLLTQTMLHSCVFQDKLGVSHEELNQWYEAIERKLKEEEEQKAIQDTIDEEIATQEAKTEKSK